MQILNFKLLLFLALLILYSKTDEHCLTGGNTGYASAFL